MHYNYFPSETLKLSWVQEQCLILIHVPCWRSTHSRSCLRGRRVVNSSVNDPDTLCDVAFVATHGLDLTKPGRSTLMDTACLCRIFQTLCLLSIFWYMNRLCLCGEAADSFSGYKCYIHMWNIALEISICTSDPSVDSITHVVLLSKELGFLDMLENGTLLANSGMDE